jgi:hypothetical protein
MKTKNRLWMLTALAIVSIAASVNAAPLITAIQETGTGLNANAAIATSATSLSTSGTSAALNDESFSFNNRTHEWTAAVTDNTTGLLSTTTGNAGGAPLATQTVQPFPSYLKGLEYVQLANDNRTIADYSVNLTFSAPVKGYLFIDNRNNGTTNVITNPITTDPVLGGSLAWVVNDGWTRVKTGFMPNGQSDYIGIDEGATVANEAARVHTGSGNVAGSGFGVNNFFAIYTKNFPAGLNTGVSKAQALNSNMYGLAFATVPEPSTIVLAACAFGGLLLARCRRVV